MADIVVTAIGPQDRARWAELWRGYLDFYETELPPEIYEHTWQRLIAAESPIRGLGARLGSDTAPLVGITHYLFHAHAWMTQEVCYLQYLFVDATARRHGCARDRPRARLRQALLDDERGQHRRPIALRPHRPLQRLHPLRLPAALRGESLGLYIVSPEPEGKAAR